MNQSMNKYKLVLKVQTLFICIYCFRLKVIENLTNSKERMFTFVIKCENVEIGVRQLLSLFQWLSVLSVIQVPSVFHFYQLYCIWFVPILVSSLSWRGCRTIRLLELGLKLSICNSSVSCSTPKTTGKIAADIRV